MVMRAAVAPVALSAILSLVAFALQGCGPSAGGGGGSDKVCCHAKTAACEACKQGSSIQSACLNALPKTLEGCNQHNFCPQTIPAPETKCTPPRSISTNAFQDDVACPYDILRCPNGNEHPTSTATCSGGRWRVAQAMISCNANPKCPKERPEPSESCFNHKHLEGQAPCEYSFIDCGDGKKHATSFAECHDGEWLIAELTFQCPGQPLRLFSTIGPNGAGGQFSITMCVAAVSAALTLGAVYAAFGRYARQRDVDQVPLVTEDAEEAIVRQ